MPVIHYHSYYKGFSEEQFAADEYFQQWILTPGSEINDFWQSYLNRFPGDLAAVQKARELVKELAADSNVINPLSSEEKAEIKIRIYKHLHLNENSGAGNRFFNRKTYRILSAASVIFIIAISTFFWIRLPGEASPVLITVSADNETKKITLPDSSVVILNAGSIIKYKNNFLAQPNREIFLEGNAFFKITKQPDQQNFIVHSKSLDITVLGTQFNVDARTGATDVGLTSGKVKITQPGKPVEAYILPGERIVLDTIGQELIKSKFDTRLYSAWTENNWNFQRTSLEDIAELIHEYYGIKSEFKNQKHRKVKITAVIPVTSLDMLVRILSKTLHINITRKNDRLIIQ